MGRLWPSMDNPVNAAQAVQDGAVTAFIVSGLTGVVATASIVVGEPIAGIDGWSYIDSLLMAVAGWRIKNSSITWTSFVLVYWSVAVAVKFLGQQLGGSVVSLLFLLFFINALRGVLAQKRQSQHPEAQVS